jgi:murein DD-endopeptidase MepM/ murein hydrolase activator NlpD
VPRTPAHAPGTTVAIGAHLHVPPSAWLLLRVPGGRLSVASGDVLVTGCDALRLITGRASLSAASRVTLATPHGDVTARAPGTRVRLRLGPRRAELTVDAGSAVLRPAAPADGLPLMARRGDLAIAARGAAPRLNVWPFGRSLDERAGRARDHLPPYWADGSGCATGCRPAGARDGWPLRPFHRQHGLRSGLNEWRPSGMHVGIDIQARNRARVYAVQSGVARVLVADGVDERVQVGSYVYWHVNHRVRSGQFVRAHRTVLGTLIPTARHLHLSEVRGGRYVNPLRPGGRVLKPWADTTAPVIGPPVLGRSTGVEVEVFDPQSYREHVGYRTPVLAPAAVAYRASDGDEHDLSGLRFSYRGAHTLEPQARDVVYTNDAYPPGWTCFATRDTCVPRWDYRLTGGFAPALPRGTRYLTIYAWDWAGNTSARRVDLLHPPPRVPGRASAALTRLRAPGECDGACPPGTG